MALTRSAPCNMKPKQTSAVAATLNAPLYYVSLQVVHVAAYNLALNRTIVNSINLRAILYYQNQLNQIVRMILKYFAIMPQENQERGILFQQEAFPTTSAARYLTCHASQLIAVQSHTSLSHAL